LFIPENILITELITQNPDYLGSSTFYLPFEHAIQSENDIAVTGNLAVNPQEMPRLLFSVS
jgi:hypothetical protein